MGVAALQQRVTAHEVHDGDRRLHSHREQRLADLVDLAAIHAELRSQREIVLRAEKYGFDFALSMIKLRGFGGKSRFWDDNLESFTLMAGLASITDRIELYATVAVLTLPPAHRRAHGDDHRFDQPRPLRREPGHRLAEGRIRPDGPVAGRRALQAPLRPARRIRDGDAGAVGDGPVRPQGQVLHHERLPAGRRCRRGRSR